MVPEYPALVPDADGEVPGSDLPLVDQPEPALGRVGLGSEPGHQLLAHEHSDGIASRAKYSKREGEEEKQKKQHVCAC